MLEPVEVMDLIPEVPLVKPGRLANRNRHSIIALFSFRKVSKTQVIAVLDYGV